MADTVSIPADVAKALADHIRARGMQKRSERYPNGPYVPADREQAWIDLLDPQPPTLREQVAKAWCADYYGDDSGSALNPHADQLAAADAVLAVVAVAFTTFADEHCFRLPEGDYAIKTRAVGEWLRGAS